MVDLQTLGTASILLLGLRRVSLPPWSVGAAVLCALNPWLPSGGAFNENTQAEFLLVATPLLFFGPVWAAGFLALIALAFAFLLTPSHMAWGALGGLAFLTLVRLAAVEKWRPAAFAALALGISGIVLALIHVAEIRELFLPRLQLYVGTVQMWGENPIFGNGLGAFSHLWPNFANADASIFTGMTFLHANDPSVLPGTAHNEYLQVLAEMGIVGFLLFLGAIAYSFRWDWRSGPSLAVLGLLMAVDAPLHDPQTLFLGALALGIASPIRPKLLKLPKLSAISAFPVVFAAIFSAWLGISHTRAEVSFGIARFLSQDRPQFAFAMVAQAHRMFPWDFKYRLQLFPTLTAALLSGKIQTTWQDIDLVYGTSHSAVPDSPALMLSRVILLRAGGRCESECEAMVLRVKRLNPRLLAAKNV